MLADLTGAELIAVKVVPRYPQTYFEGGVALAAKKSQKLKAWNDEALEAVNAIKAKGQLNNVKVKATTVKSRSSAEALIASAKRHKCDLIVMASHGRRGLRRLLVGSKELKTEY